MMTLPLARHAVAKHPLFSSFKVDYLFALEYFLRKYGEGSIQAREAFKVYEAKLSSRNPYSYCGDDKAIEIVRSFLGTRFDFLTAHYRCYRACLLMDCLFMLAYSDPDKAQIILDDFCSLSVKRYHKLFYRLFDYLYAGKRSEPFRGIRYIKHQLECLDAEKIFERKPLRRILFTASMSAGKSTLINALIGKKITQTQSEACTGKIHFIYNKPYEDGFTAKWEDSLNMNATEEQLMAYDGNSDKVRVWTYFRSFLSDNFRWCLIDTPGVNFSLNSEHLNITRRTIEHEAWDYLIYIVNGEYTGTNDDKNHLEYIFQHVPDSKIIFVLNKLDRYSAKDDSIPDAVMKLRNDLEQIGFKNPIILPISAYTAMLAKKCIFRTEFNSDEADEFDFLRRKFLRTEYDLSIYSTGLTETDRMQRFAIPKRFLERKNPLASDCYQLLINSGLLGFEKILGDNE
jgi:GTP-binding protein EngB required for normal cell division